MDFALIVANTTPCKANVKPTVFTVTPADALSRGPGSI
jgi:hypothetical protein